MSRYIDADKLYPDKLTKDGSLAISQSQIAAQPTADVAEVKHGEWIRSLNKSDDECYLSHKCSVCGEMVWRYMTYSPEWNYCPNCGAKMLD